MTQITIQRHRNVSLVELLNEQGFQIETLAGSVIKAVKSGELPVFMQINDGQIYFEVDLGNVQDIADQALYFNLLDLNTEILPVSIGINNTNPQDPRLVLVESRELENLDDNELLNVFAAFELAVDKVTPILAAKLN